MSSEEQSKVLEGKINKKNYKHMGKSKQTLDCIKSSSSSPSSSLIVVKKTKILDNDSM